MIFRFYTQLSEGILFSRSFHKLDCFWMCWGVQGHQKHIYVCWIHYVQLQRHWTERTRTSWEITSAFICIQFYLHSFMSSAVHEGCSEKAAQWKPKRVHPVGQEGVWIGWRLNWLKFDFLLLIVMIHILTYFKFQIIPSRIQGEFFSCHFSSPSLLLVCFAVRWTAPKVLSALWLASPLNLTW